MCCSLMQAVCRSVSFKSNPESEMVWLDLLSSPKGSQGCFSELVGVMDMHGIHINAEVFAAPYLCMKRALFH